MSLGSFYGVELHLHHNMAKLEAPRAQMTSSTN